MPHLHIAYDPYALAYRLYELYLEKISKEGSELISRFPYNLANPHPINLPVAHHFHLSFTSSTLSPQTLATGQSQRWSKTSAAQSPERRQGSKQKTDTRQHPEFDYLYYLDIFCRISFVSALCIFIVFLYTAMSG
jgi:hypothetical protein